MRNYGDPKLKKQDEEIIKNRVSLVAHSMGHWWLALNGLAYLTETTKGETNANTYSEYVMKNLQLHEIENTTKYSKP